MSEESSIAIIKKMKENDDKVAETPFSDLTVGELIELYADLRDMLSAERKSFKATEASIKSDLEKIEMNIMEKQRELGVESLSTHGLTAFQTTKTSVRMGDWDAFSKWILETGNTQCIEKRPAKLACIEIENEGTDLSTIGLEKTKEICIQVRKK